jgi:hypothetical protein
MAPSVRKHNNGQLGLSMKIPRVRRSIDALNINLDVNRVKKALQAIKNGEESDDIDFTKEYLSNLFIKSKTELKDGVSVVVADKADSIVSDNRLKVNLLTKQNVDDFQWHVQKNRKRFSSDSIVMVTAILEYVIKKIIGLGIKKTHELKRSIIQPSFIKLDDMKTLDIYSLISRVVSVEENTDEEEESPNNCEFMFYVNLIFKEVKNEYIEKSVDYKSIRISKSFKSYCSNLTVEVINALAPILSIVSENSRVRTITKKIARCSAEIIMTLHDNPCRDVLEYADGICDKFSDLSNE